MTALWLIIRREFVSNVLTSRFIIGFLVNLLAIGVAVFVQVDHYENRLTAYHTAIRETQGESDLWNLYSDISPKAHRKPNPLGIFNVGMENVGANTISIELPKPIWGGSPDAQKRGSDNPFLARFLTVDVTFVSKIVLSALAILFAYNTISGESEDGTLKLVLSNPISRGILVLGKYLGGMLSLLPIILISFLVAFLLAQTSPVTDFDGADMGRISLILVLSLFYVSTWYLVGLLLSVWTKEAATTLILSMFIWVLLTIVHSNLTLFAVEKFPPHPVKSTNRVSQTIELWEEFKRERDTYLKKRGYQKPLDTVSWPPNTQSTGGGSLSGSSPFHLAEKWTPNSLEVADTSKYQEFLGWQEPLRVRYADRVGAILRKTADDQEKNAQFADDISRISFAEVYRFAVGTIAGTNRESYRDFLLSARTYKREIVNYLIDKEAFSSRQWFADDQGKAVFTDMPTFQHRRPSLLESLSRAQGDFFILFAWNLILFMAAYLSFLRYDMS